MKFCKEAIFKLAEAFRCFICTVRIVLAKRLTELTLYKSFCGIVLRDVYDALRQEVIRIDCIQSTREFYRNFVYECFVNL